MLTDSQAARWRYLSRNLLLVLSARPADCGTLSAIASERSTHIFEVQIHAHIPSLRSLAVLIKLSAANSTSFPFGQSTTSNPRALLQGPSAIPVSLFPFLLPNPYRSFITSPHSFSPFPTPCLVLLSLLSLYSLSFSFLQPSSLPSALEAILSSPFRASFSVRSSQNLFLRPLSLYPTFFGITCLGAPKSLFSFFELSPTTLVTLF